MSDLTPRQPEIPLRWSDAARDLRDLLADVPTPAYLVGGAVRDALLGRPIKDVDIVTPESGIRLARQIANRMQGDFFPLDAERDVGRALVDTSDGRLLIDVARWRGDNLYADLLDRDFTINAMAVDLHGDLSLLIDPLGGERDTKGKILRRCTPDAIRRDPIRVLRAVRLSVQLGMRIEPETLADTRAVAPRLPDVSPERVRDEFYRILALPKVAQALRVADTLGVLHHVVPEVAPLHGLKQPPPHVFDGWQHTLMVVENLVSILATIGYNRSDETAAQFSLGMIVVAFHRYRAQLNEHIERAWADERPHRALLILAALLHDAGKPETDFPPETGYRRFSGHADKGAQLADARAAALRLSNAERQRLATIVANHMRPLWLDNPTPRALHRFWRATGEAGVDVCLLALADYLGTRGAHLEQDGWLAFVERIAALLNAYYEQRARLVEPPPLVDGRTLMKALGLKPGPAIGELLDLIREGQVEGEVQSADDALRFARAYLDGKDTHNGRY